MCHGTSDCNTDVSTVGTSAVVLSSLGSMEGRRRVLGSEFRTELPVDEVESKLSSVTPLTCVSSLKERSLPIFEMLEVGVGGRCRYLVILLAGMMYLGGMPPLLSDSVLESETTSSGLWRDAVSPSIALCPVYLMSSDVS